MDSFLRCEIWFDEEIWINLRKLIDDVDSFLLEEYDLNTYESYHPSIIIIIPLTVPSRRAFCICALSKSEGLQKR